MKTRRLEDKSTTTRRRLSPEKRREEVIQVAAEVFARKGYRAANVTAANLEALLIKFVPKLSPTSTVKFNGIIAFLKR